MEDSILWLLLLLALVLPLPATIPPDGGARQRMPEWWGDDDG